MKEFLEANRGQIWYFVLAILVIGSMGIWLPYIIDGESDEITFFQNGTTYFIAVVVAGCLDLIIHAIKSTENARNIISTVLFYVFLLIVFLGVVVFNCFMIKDHNSFWAYIITIAGILFAWTLWWISNNANKSDQFSALGGNDF